MRSHTPKTPALAMTPLELCLIIVVSLASTAAFIGFLFWLVNRSSNDDCDDCESCRLSCTTVPQASDSQSPPPEPASQEDVDDITNKLCWSAVHGVSILVFYSSAVYPQPDNERTLASARAVMFGTGFLLTYWTMCGNSSGTCRILSGCLAVAMGNICMMTHGSTEVLGAAALGWAWYWVGCVAEWRLALIYRFAVYMATVSSAAKFW